MTEPRVITVKRYVCPFCLRGRSKRAAIVAHLALCWRNPENRGCRTCEFFEVWEAEPEVGYTGELVCHKGLSLLEPHHQGCECRVYEIRTGCELYEEAVDD